MMMMMMYSLRETIGERMAHSTVIHQVAYKLTARRHLHNTFSLSVLKDTQNDEHLARTAEIHNHSV